jgi:hypothetical protein
MRAVPLENLLRACIAALVVFATMMLGFGEGSVVLTLISLVAVVVSIYVTDVTKAFQFSQGVANWVALGVVVVAVANMLYIDRAAQIVAVANLQSYLQYVLLFQPKTTRVYWQLGVLSLGQVAIASTLVPGPLFGLMLLAYMFLGVFTFTLVQLWGESVRFVSPTTGVRDAAGRAGRAFQLASRPLTAAGIPGSFAAIAGGLLRQAVAIIVATIAVTMVLFFFLPRWATANREASNNEPVRAVGFSKTITLGELGEVVQNPQVVMRIQFFRGLSMRPFQLAEDPLLRGTVVTHYESGSWTQGHSGSMAALPSDTGARFVRQRIEVEPMDVSELFCVVPFFALSQDARLRVNASGEQLVRQDDCRSQRMEFEIGTTGIVGDRPRKIIPCEWPLRLRQSRRRLLQMPEADSAENDPLFGLRETAARVLREKGVDPGDRVATARALHDYLKFSGNYAYSLEGVERDPDLDPLEDFVTTHRSGHCEYFAGALTMMLRSQGIPARVAIGYKGGEWNPVGMYYQVQQLHAHAWVEVYLDQEDFPPEAFKDGDDGLPPGAWLVLDPTVSVEDTSGGPQDVGLWVRMRQYFDYAQVLWANYVVGLNSKRQQQGIYGPLAAGAQAAFDNAFGREVWRARMRAVAASPLGTFWEWYRRHWFSWRGGLVAAGASLVLVFGYFGVRQLLSLVGRLVRGARAARGAPTLEIYRRLEAALARQGLIRHPAQTAYEFATSAGGHLAESIEHHRVSHLPRRIVESFYRVRFGHRPLDNLEAVAVEQALADLESALRRGR